MSLTKEKIRQMSLEDLYNYFCYIGLTDEEMDQFWQLVAEVVAEAE
jgi:hypothetical protein